MADKYSKAVNKVIRSGTDQINLERAFVLIDILNKNRNHDFEIFEAIHHCAINSDRREKLNAISFIDVLFKNGNKNLLTALQGSNSILGISDEPVVSDPFVHRTLCAAADSWANACQNSHCLTQSFLDWQRRLFSFKYRYVMTAEMQAKFSSDFSTAFELLSMFSQALITAKSQGIPADDETLIEMVTNVNEVNKRLNELEDTMVDKYVLSIIHYLEDYCDICKQCYSLYSSSGQFDNELLQDISRRGIPSASSPDAHQQQPPQHQQPQYQPSQPQFQPPPQQQQQFNSQQQQFNSQQQQFNTQQQQLQKPPQAEVVDDLISFSNVPDNKPPQQSQFQQPNQYQQPQVQYPNLQQPQFPNQQQPNPQQQQYNPFQEPLQRQQQQQQQQQFNQQQPSFPPPFQNSQQQQQLQQQNQAGFPQYPQASQQQQFNPFAQRPPQQQQQYNPFAQQQQQPQQQQQQKQSDSFEFAPDVDGGGVTDEQFNAFLGNIHPSNKQ